MNRSQMSRLFWRNARQRRGGGPDFSQTSPGILRPRSRIKGKTARLPTLLAWRESISFSPPAEFCLPRRHRRKKTGTVAQKHMPLRLWLLGALLALALWQGPYAAARLLCLPGSVRQWMADAAGRAVSQSLAELHRENALLRADMGRYAALREENAALREMAGCSHLPATFTLAGCGAVLWPCRLQTLCPQFYGGNALPSPLGISLSVSHRAPTGALQAGGALLDDSGRFAGILTQVQPHSAQASCPGCGAAALICAVGEGEQRCTGLLVRRQGTLRLESLPGRSGLHAGAVVTTLGAGLCPDGLWVGRLSSDPVLQQNGLCADAELCDTAKADSGLLFAIVIPKSEPG